MPNRDVNPGGAQSAHPLASFRREMDRMFDNFFGGGIAHLPAWPAADFRPKINVSENDKEVTVEAELAGVDEKDLKVKVQDDVLTVSGEKKSKKEEKTEDWHVIESSYGSFARSVRLPSAVDRDKAKASFKNGVLTITLPKATGPESKSRQIPIG